MARTKEEEKRLEEIFGKILADSNQKDYYEGVKDLYTSNRDNNIAQLEREREQALKEADDLEVKINKYLPEQLKASGLSGVGYNEQTLLNAQNQMARNKLDINNTYNKKIDSANQDYINALLGIVGNAHNESREDMLREDERSYQKGLLEDERTYQKGLLDEERAYQSGQKESDRAYQKELLEDERAYKETQQDSNRKQNLENMFLGLLTGNKENDDKVLGIMNSLGLGSDIDSYNQEYARILQESVNNINHQDKVRALEDLFSNASATDKARIYDSLAGGSYQDETIKAFIDSLGLTDAEKSQMMSEFAVEIGNEDNFVLNQQVEEAITIPEVRYNRNYELADKSTNITLDVGGQDVVVKYNADSVIDQDSDVGQKLLDKIQSLKGGSQARRGDVIQYYGKFWIVNNDGNFCELTQWKDRNQDWQYLREVFTTATQQ